MDDLQFDDLEFPLGWCAPCGREVLTAAGEDGASRLCVHCDEPVNGAIRQARGVDLGDSGYALHEQQGGCGRADCGGGRCGRP